MTRPSIRRALTGAAALFCAGGLALAASLAPAAATTIGGVQPVRAIAVGSNLPLQAIANDGTIYSAYSGKIDVWAADSDGTHPDIIKTFTGADVTGQPQLDEVRGLAYATTTPAAGVVVMDPHQAAGAVVATRRITGALTQLDNPSSAAWAPDGSLWVQDSTAAGDPELLRFAPGVTGNVAPVQQITGPRTALARGAVIGSTGFVAGMPDNGVAFAMATVGNPSLLIFTGAQHGNVAPAHRVAIPTPSPHWISEGLASDALGRLYIGSGDVNGNYFGRLDVYSKTGQSLVTLGGVGERFQVPLVPTVAKNGNLAMDDALIIALGSSTTQAAQVQVYKPLFARPGAVRSLHVAKSSSSLTISWLPPSNLGGTPPSYALAITKGTKKLLSKTVTATKLVVARGPLAKGSLKVTVTAVNVGGAGPATSKSFTN